MTLSRKKQYRKDLNVYERWAETTIKRHRKRGMAVELELYELAELARKTTHCPICGVQFTWDFTKWDHDNPNLPTLDRNDNERVLHSRNIMILCKRCNGLKANLTLAEMAEWCLQYLRFYTRRRRW